MKIAIIGTGNVGGALAKQWSKAGHHILLGVRDVDHFKGNDLLNNQNTFVHSIPEAAQQADVILIAAIPQATIDIANALGDVKGKIIIDAMNSFRIKPEGYAHTFAALQDVCKNAEIVKCFNSTGFENMENPQYGDTAIDMFVAGNSEKGKATATQLAKDAGFGECYDFGGDDRVELLEQFALAWINLAIFQKHGRDMAFKIIKR